MMLSKRLNIKTKVDSIDEIEGKIPSISGFLPTNTFNSKVTDNQNCSVKARYKQFGQ